jgi:hypothetical protein
LQENPCEVVLYVVREGGYGFDGLCKQSRHGQNIVA